MSDSSQIEVNSTARPRVTFYSGGTPSDLDSGVPTVVATKPDGTTLTPAPTAAHVGATGSGIYELTDLPAQTTLTLLRLDWTGTIGALSQTLTTWIEVVGAFPYTLASMRDLKVAGGTPFKDATKYPDADLLATRVDITDELDRILGFSPIPRFARETRDGNGSCHLRLWHRKPATLLSVTVGGVTRATTDFTLSSSGLLTWTNGWFPGWTRQNVIVEYVHGWDRIMGRGGNIAMLMAALQLQPGLSSAVTTVSTPDGSNYTFDAAGQVTQSGRVRETGVPVIDAWLNRWTEANLVMA